LNRSQFQAACEGHVLSDIYLNLSAVLDEAYALAINLDPAAQLIAEASHERTPLTLAWLEVVFFADFDQDDVEFYGIQAVSLDMAAAEPELVEFPPIVMDGEVGDPQALDWEWVNETVRSFNLELPEPLALPFVRIAMDATRARSLYYRLKGYDYLA
jgi:hypothetical protein